MVWFNNNKPPKSKKATREEKAKSKWAEAKAAATSAYDKGQKARKKYDAEAKAAWKAGRGVYEKTVSKEDRQRIAAEYNAQKERAKKAAEKYAPEAKEAWKAAKSAEKKSRKSQGRPMY